jgi:hypothetical protein
MVNRSACIAIVLAVVTAGPGAAQPASPPAAMPALTGRSDDVPPDMQQAVIEKFARSFLLPQLVMWDFGFMQPYPTGGIAVCGFVNYPDSTRQYVGKLPFFARFQAGRIVQAGIVARSHLEDPVHASADAHKIACADH